MKYLLLSLLLLPSIIVAQFILPPTVSHGSGFYTDSFYVKVTHTDPGVTILYTLDGSEPKIENLTGRIWNYKKFYPTNPGDPFGDLLQQTIWTHQYTDSLKVRDRSNEPDKYADISTSFYMNQLHVDTADIIHTNIFKGTVVRVVAYKNGNYSNVVTNNYFVSPAGVNKYTLPILSVNLEPDEFYGYENGINVPGILFDQFRVDYPDYNESIKWAPANFRESGNDSEIKIHFSYLLNGNEVLSQGAGLRINGNGTRRFPNKSFRLYARSEYGPNKFNYPFFDNYNYNKFDRILLRNSGDDVLATTFRDTYMHDLVKNLNFDIQESKPAILFINSEYNGLRNIRENYDAKYFERIYDLESDELDFIENNGIVNEGDSMHFVAMMDYFRTHSLTGEANYRQALTFLDPINFTDYFVANIFLANRDWPNNNNEFWRKKVPYDSMESRYGHDGRFRWVLKDTDRGYNLNYTDECDFNMIEWTTQVLDANDGPDYEFYNNATLVFRKLLENENYKHYFLNRFADLMNTTFTIQRSIDRIEYYRDLLSTEIEENSERWTGFVAEPAFWENHVDVLVDFAVRRPGFQRAHILEKFGIEDNVKLALNVSDTAHGYIHLNTIDILTETDGIDDNPYIWTGSYFKNIPVTLTAIPKEGYSFSHWSGHISGTNAEITFPIEDSIYIKANFIEAPLNSIASSKNMNDLKVYPNPAKETITVEPGTNYKNASIRIIDLQGKEVYSNFLSADTTKWEINVAQLIPGIYILNFEEKYFRFVKE